VLDRWFWLKVDQNCRSRYSTVRHLGRIECARVKTPEVLKSGVNPKRSLKETHVFISRYLTIRHLGVSKCAKAKNPKVPKSEVNPDHSSKGTHVKRSTCLGIQHSG
jgi:hypothetical protein